MPSCQPAAPELLKQPGGRIAPADPTTRTPIPYLKCWHSAAFYLAVAAAMVSSRRPAVVNRPKSSLQASPGVAPPHSSLAHRVSQTSNQHPSRRGRPSEEMEFISTWTQIEIRKSLSSRWSLPLYHGTPNPWIVSHLRGSTLRVSKLNASERRIQPLFKDSCTTSQTSIVMSNVMAML